MVASPDYYHSSLPHSTVKDRPLDSKSVLGYTPYAVHLFPGAGGTSGAVVPVSLNASGLKHSVCKFSVEKPLKNAEDTHSAWDMHPSLKTLLGDFCSDIDVNKAVNSYHIQGFPGGKSGIAETKFPSTLTSSRKLSVVAPEFVPSFLNPHHSPPSAADPDSNQSLCFPDDQNAPANSEQIFNHGCNAVSSPVDHSHFSERFTDKNNSFTNAEDQNLISFDCDVSSISAAKRSGTASFLANDKRAVKDEHSHSNHFGRSFTPALQEGKKECTEQDRSASVDPSASFATPSVLYITTPEHCSEKITFQKPAAEKVSSAQLDNDQKPVKTDPPPSHGPIFSPRLIFKTYAEASNFYYSLLEEQIKEQMFQGSSRPQPPSQPPSPGPPGLPYPKHTFDRPNWAAAPEDVESWRSDGFNRHVSNCSNAETDEYPVVMQGNHIPRDSRGSDEFNHNKSGMNCVSDTNDSFHSRRGPPSAHSTYALSDKGDRNGADVGSLEREIDGFHDTLRAKANRSFQAQGTRAKPGNGSSNLGSYSDLEKEIDEYHGNLRAKANRASQAQSARARNGDGPPSSDGGRHGRGLSRKHDVSGENWKNHSLWGPAENGRADDTPVENDGSGWGCE